MNKQDQPAPSYRKLPKGAYSLPIGGFVTESHCQMGKRKITIQVIHHEHIDSKELAKLFVMVVEEMDRNKKRH